ncbi:hypothetical protein D9M72_105130 [compost metagenome]
MSQEPVKFDLPLAMRRLFAAQQEVVSHYAETRLKFTLDGRLVGDLAEAIALEFFDIVPCKKRTNGADAEVRDSGALVQVKSSGSGRGPTFSKGGGTAKYLLFLELDFVACTATVAYNGLEAPIRALLPQDLKHSTEVKLALVREHAPHVAPDDQVPLKRKPAAPAVSQGDESLVTRVIPQAQAGA